MANLFIPSISKIGPHRSGETNFYEGALSKGFGEIGKESAGEIDGEFAQKLLKLLGIKIGEGEENVSDDFIEGLNSESIEQKGLSKELLTSLLENSEKTGVDYQKSLVKEFNKPLEKVQIEIDQLAKDLKTDHSSTKINEKLEMSFGKGRDLNLPHVADSSFSRSHKISSFSDRNLKYEINDIINGTNKKSLSKGEIPNLKVLESNGADNIEPIRSFKNKSKMMNAFTKNSNSEPSLLNLNKLDRVYDANQLNKESVNNIFVSEGGGKGNIQNSDISASPLSLGLKVSDANALDLSKISPKNSVDLVNEVTTYIEKNRLENAGEISLTVKHDDLGQFKIDVSKARSGKNIDLSLTTTTGEASEFFKLNEGNLLKTLGEKGINVSSFKLSSLTDELGKSDFGNNGQSEGQNSSRQQRQFGESGQNQGRQKREQLWEAYKERLGA